jgi:formylglycine-generating enzyme required for sulfatase activity
MRHGIMRSCSYIVVLILIACGLVSCNKDAESPTGPADSTGFTITGRILTGSVGLVSVIVYITGTDTDMSTVTGSDGSYTFTDLPEGAYEIMPSRVGYTFEPTSRTIEIGADTSIDDFDATETDGGGGGDPHDIEGITFVTIPGGTFLMGDLEGDGYDWEKPVHVVTVSGFEMGIYEVTNARYAKYLTDALASGDITSTSSHVKGASGIWSGKEYIYLGSQYCQISYNYGTFTVDSGMEDRPVVEITWYGAKAFAMTYGFDLPTEAEWEYACRGGLQLMYGTDDGTLSSAKVNYGGNVSYASDVGSYPHNPFGIHDMSGNVWEWCHDWHGIYPDDSVTDPSGVLSGTFREVRGGSWGSSANYCRSSGRYFGNPEFSYSFLGFRVVRRSSPVNY